MKLLKKVLFEVIIIVITITYQGQALATTVSFITDANEIEKVINENQNKEEKNIIKEVERKQYEKEIKEGTFQDDTEEIITKTLYSIENVDNMSVAGTNRGNWHDRQHLGMYMKAGASFKIRQTTPNLNQDLTLNCLNNDSATEVSYTIPKNGEWVTVTVENDSVPFIKTPHNTKEQPVVEMKNLQNTEDLTYYYYKDSETEFFEKWNQNNHSYAVIENDRTTFLVPLKDREEIVAPDKGSYRFASIDNMLEYYYEFVEQFDRYIGLSYQTDNPLNQNVKTKFFVKANIHGAGAAYYGGDHTAQNGDSIVYYLGKGWLSLHEFGHGYGGKLAGQDLSLGEVMNNILAHYYQITFLEEDDGGWLGKKLKIEENMKKAREETSKFNDMTYQQRLYVFVNLLDKIGPERSMAYVHSKYREYLSNGIQYNASDMYAKSFSEISGYNVIPYLNSSNIVPSQDIQAQVYEQNLPMLYYLRDIVDSNEEAETIRKELNLEGNYSLVSNQDIEKYDKKGNLSLKISIDNFEQVKQKKVYLKDGKKIVKEIVIDEKEIEVKDIPVGIYTLQMPNTKTEAYEYSYQYVVIQENNTTKKEVNYEKIQMSPLLSDTQIQFRGLGDWLFATATMDLTKKELTQNSVDGSPHVYFKDEYANIKILDQQGNKVYEKSYIGDQKNSSNDVIKIDFGYTIKIQHKEAKSRLIFHSELLNQKEDFGTLTSEEITYTITEYGLQKEETSKAEQYQKYIEKLDQYIEKTKNEMTEDKQQNKYCYFIQKNKLLASILHLQEAEQKQYLQDNQIVINGSAPVIGDIQKLEFVIGDELEIKPNHFKANDLEDGEMLLDNSNTQIILNIPNENNKAIEAGEYTTQVIIKDSDENETMKDFAVIVNNKEEENKEEENKEEENKEEENKEEENKEEENKEEENKEEENKEEENKEEENKEEENKEEENKEEENNKEQEHKEDSSKAPGRLPQTGENILIGMSIIGILGFAILQYIKMRRMK